MALTGRLEIDLLAPAPVGAFVDVRASRAGEEGRRMTLESSASVDGEPVARARGTFVRMDAN